MSIITPVHGLSLFTRITDSRAYARIAPTGVEALNTAMCLRHSDRGSDVANREVVKARTAGAVLSQRQLCRG
jgi:hypothetical protein